MRRLALDLFCGAGGAARGLQRAGFFVVGVDIKRQPRYAGNLFIQGDALRPPVQIEDFDFVWASPPCQRYSRGLNGRWGNGYRDRHPDHLPRVREALLGAEVPFVIENVPGAPMRADTVLSGAMFGLPIERERWFECHGFRAPFALAQRWQGRTTTNGGLACVAGHGANRGRNPQKWRDMPPALRRSLSERNSAAGWREAMQMPWATRDEIREAIPPAYAEFIGRAAMCSLQEGKAA